MARPTNSAIRFGRLASALLLALAGCNTVNDPTPALPGSSTDPATTSYYTGRVEPIFKKHCYRCHAGINRRGGLSMSTTALMMKGGKTGRDIVPGDPDASLMVKLLRHQPPPGGPESMPSKSAKLADADIAMIEQWIRAGAVTPVDTPHAP